LPSAQTPIDARHRHVSSLQQQPLRSLAQPTEKTAPQNHHRFFHRDERRTSSLCYPLPSCPPAKLSNLFVNWPCRVDPISESGLPCRGSSVKVFRLMESSQLPPSDPTGTPSQPNPAPPFLRPPPLPGPPRYGPPRGKGRGWKIVSLVLGLLLVFSLFGNVQHWASSLIRVAGPTRTSAPRLEETFIEDNDS